MEELIHLKHSMDYMPLCWPMTSPMWANDVPFLGTLDPKEVTCPVCHQIDVAIDAEISRIEAASGESVSPAG